MALDEPPSVPDPGIAGASAAREHDRRKAARVHKTLMHHPFADKIDVTLRDGPAHERAFDIGAGGERTVARVLAKRLRPDAISLHDRAMPGGRGNIDHIVVAPSGVWVIDTKRYSGKLSVWQPASGRGMLAVAGRDKTRLIDALARQVETVAASVAELAGGVALHGALCFVETDLPQGQRLTFEGWHVATAAQLAKRINITTARLAPDSVHALALGLSQRFASA